MSITHTDISWRSRNKQWMGDLKQRYATAFTSIPINQLLMIGTHDSGTYHLEASGKTQKLNILEQLEYGIRYFDFRPRVHDSTYYIVHGGSGPDGTADLGHYSASIQPDGVGNDNYIFKKMRDFLKTHPDEILILKFQGYEQFNTDDYFNLIKLIKAYFTFDSSSKCVLSTLNEGTGAFIAQETVGSLLSANKRVFIIWDVKNVPGKNAEMDIWDWAFKFGPSLTPTAPFNLWDPYWHDKSDSLADDETPAQLQAWWEWHAKNLDTWDENNLKGFFVLQSHMRQLPVGSAVDSAKNNNMRNITRYLAWAAEGKPMNIMTFDFVSVDHYNGDQESLVDRVVAYYHARLSPASVTLLQPFRFYRLINSLVGDSRALSTNDDNDRKLFMSEISGSPDQYWQFLPNSNGNYRVINLFLGQKYSLDIDYIHALTPHMDTTSKLDSYQQWRLELKNGWYLLTESYSHENYSLFVSNKEPFVPFIADFNHQPEQRWKLGDTTEIK